MRVAILGAGQMGTAFGAPAVECGHEVYFWGPDWIDTPHLEAIAVGKPHPDLGTPLPDRPAGTTTNLKEALEDADMCVLAVASEGIGWVSRDAAKLTKEEVPMLVLTKGLVELDDKIVPVTTLVEKAFKEERVLIGAGGPVKAGELIRKIPTHTVFASAEQESSQYVAKEFSTTYYFPTTTKDLIGTEVCAALKNCYAIAINLVAGSSGPSNLRALAFSAALREMFVLTISAGGSAETIAGAPGSGDLYVTCLTGRNGNFGQLLNKGYSPEKALTLMNNPTVEGLGTLDPALKLAQSMGFNRNDLPLLYYLSDVLQNGGVGERYVSVEDIVTK